MKREMDEQEDFQKRMRVVGALMTIPFVLAVPPVIGLYVGEWLDGKLGTWIFMPLLLVLGVVAGIRECYRLIKKYGRL